jgi:mono/diheme cytochrome c family protein
MKNNWRLVLLACTIAAAMAITACGAKKEEAAPQTPAAQTPAAQTPATTPPATTQPTPAATAVNAESIVKANCIACHGDTLAGNGNERRNLTKVGSKLTKEQLVTTITSGRGGMPAFKDKLKDTEIAAVAEWLAAKK